MKFGTSGLELTSTRAEMGRPQSSACYTGGDVDGTKIAGLAGVKTAASE